MKRSAIVAAIFMFSFLCLVQGLHADEVPNQQALYGNPLESIWQYVRNIIGSIFNRPSPPPLTVPAAPAQPLPKAPAQPSPKAPAAPAYGRCHEDSSIGYCLGQLFQAFVKREVTSLHKNCCKEVLDVDRNCPNTVFTLFNNPVFEDFVKQHCQA
ncbi:hypothetical protein Dsin_026524 [Dipteronia sinensis]|uniref:Prolamin-like domain-containing protein n=1 Tax=Dipteronia sinensis TaxID=43782 RepID=A0AAE0DZC9_9ROSI|nr:hypothetical protein Dsin_026524 [Dipteronia sinensis]